MSDVSSASTLNSAMGQQDIALQNLRMQFQSEQMVANLASQAVQPAQPAQTSNQQPALNSSGPKGTQVNLTV
ncbi:MAG: hypothetical protein HZA67_09675 [Rhodospirillales bacterium]|jgi:hypothetical protein|nr:hypothetical protein [Rhodospirillales bacterium]